MDSVKCSLCRKDSKSVDNISILCDVCGLWFHGTCVNLCAEEIKTLGEDNNSWQCPTCLSYQHSHSSQADTTDLLPCPVCKLSNKDEKLFKGSRGLRIHWSRTHPNESPISILEEHHPFSANNFNITLSNCKSSVRVLRRIPKGVRHYAADKLTSVIDRCISINDEAS